MSQGSGASPRWPEGVKYGAIVHAWTTDRNGVRSQHYCVVLTSDADLPRVGEVVCAVVSTDQELSPPEQRVELPYDEADPSRTPTRLARRCWATVGFVQRLAPGDILSVKGEVPRAVAEELSFKMSFRWSRR